MNLTDDSFIVERNNACTTTGHFYTTINQALVRAVVKPIVGIGDGAILMLQHVIDATDEEEAKVSVPKRLRRALLRNER